MLRTNVAFWALVIANGLVASNTGAAEAEHEKVQEVVLPALTVIGEGKVARGQVTRIRLRLGQAAAGDKGPLELGIFETSPMGIGPSLRSSAWMAAMVAAFETDTLLVRRRIELHIPGYVDGPSGAALVAVGTMAALQGKQWPADVSITGSLCPDGTIGPVGGIPQKLQAASKAGIKRIFIPKDLRRDVDLATGAEVDLYALADSLKVKILPVAHIQDVAKELGFASEGAAVPQAELALPKELSRIYIQEAEQYVVSFGKTWAAMSEEEKKANAEAAATAQRGQEALRIGKEVVAVELIGKACFTLESLLAMCRRDTAMDGKLPESIDDWEKLLEAQMDRIGKTFEDSLRASSFALRFLSNTSNTAPEAGQMLAINQTDTVELRGTLTQYALALNQAIETARSSKLKGAELEKALRPWYRALIAYEELAGRQLRASHQRLLALRKCFPGRPCREPALRTCSIVEQAQLMWSAAHGYMDEGFIRARADEWDCTTVQAKSIICRIDNGYCGSILEREQTVELLQRSTEDGAANAERSSKLLSGTQPTDLLMHFLGLRFADDMAVLAGTQFEWESLGPKLDDNDRITGYTREAALPTTLNTARSRAVYAIAEAQARGINCVGSVIAVQQGDHDRDSQEGQKRNALRFYWRAYLEAKVLRSFQRQREEELAEYDKAIQDNPRNAVAQYLRGCGLMDQGKMEQALASLSKAIEVGPARAEYHSTRGHVYSSRADYSRAAVDYATAENGGTKNLSLYMGWAKALGGLGQYEKAIAACDKACGLYPDVAEAYLLRSRLFTLTNNEKKASEDLVRARELTPEWSWVDVAPSLELQVPPRQRATTQEGAGILPQKDAIAIRMAAVQRTTSGGDVHEPPPKTSRNAFSDMVKARTLPPPRTLPYPGALGDARGDGIRLGDAKDAEDSVSPGTIVLTFCLSCVGLLLLGLWIAALFRSPRTTMLWVLKGALGLAVFMALEVLWLSNTPAVSWEERAQRRLREEIFDPSHYAGPDKEKEQIDSAHKPFDSPSDQHARRQIPANPCDDASQWSTLSFNDKVLTLVVPVVVIAIVAGLAGVVCLFRVLRDPLSKPPPPV